MFNHKTDIFSLPSSLYYSALHSNNLPSNKGSLIKTATKFISPQLTLT